MAWIAWIAWIALNFKCIGHVCLQSGRKKLILLIFSSRDDTDICCYAEVLYRSHMPGLNGPNEYPKSQVDLI